MPPSLPDLRSWDEVADEINARMRVWARLFDIPEAEIHFLDRHSACKIGCRGLRRLEKALTHDGLNEAAVQEHFHLKDVLRAQAQGGVEDTAAPIPPTDPYVARRTSLRRQARRWPT